MSEQRDVPQKGDLWADPRNTRWLYWTTPLAGGGEMHGFVRPTEGEPERPGPDTPGPNLEGWRLVARPPAKPHFPPRRGDVWISVNDGKSLVFQERTPKGYMFLRRLGSNPEPQPVYVSDKPFAVRDFAGRVPSLVLATRTGEDEPRWLFTPELKIKQADVPFPVPAPGYKTAGASGLDVHACIQGREGCFQFLPGAISLRVIEGRQAVTLAPGHRCHVPVGWHFEIPPGFEAQIRSRSSLSSEGLVAVAGTIDSDYRGEISVLIENHHPLDRLAISHGDRLAQIVIAPVARATITEVADLSETARQHGGFGSTGRS